MVFEINDISISTKIQDGGRNMGNSKIFTGHKGLVLSTQVVQNLSEIALSLTVFEINKIFYFHSCYHYHGMCLIINIHLKAVTLL